MSSLWNAKQQDPLVEAQNSGATVTLTCCLLCSGAPVGMRIEGLLRNVQGREGQLVVQTMTLVGGKSRDPDDRFDFSFQISSRNSEDQGIRMGAWGSGLILKTAYGQDGKLRVLNLRFPHNYTVRPLRRSKRYLWKGEFTRLLSVMLVDKAPATREELAALLRGLQNGDLSHSQLVDISAGGVCVCLPEDMARPSFSSGSIYIVFFIPSKADEAEFPFVFLARRLGLGVEPCGKGTAVRLCFTDELNWAHHHRTLKWMPVELDGSSRLSGILSQYDTEGGTDE
ncbi:MAG: hypothetical protein J5861_04065 [Desulfovibrio sp.]|nr:hypothetical protein [Desulfovibrio sp.]